MRPWCSHDFAVRCPVDIDVAPECIASAALVVAGLLPAEPQDTCEYPVPARLLGCQFRGIDFTRGTAPHEYRIDWAAVANFQSDAVSATRRTLAAILFAGAIQCAGNQISPGNLPILQQFQDLFIQSDIYTVLH